jgi:hypothetical protein
MCLAAMLPMILIGCSSGPSGEALCTGSENARTAHAAALAKDGGDTSRATGRTLIALIDAGCDG